MAHTLPRFGAVPKTPKHTESSLHEVKTRPSDSFDACKRYLAYFIMTGMLLLWGRSLVSSPKQTDKIPFTHDPVEKYFFTTIGTYRRLCLLTDTSATSTITKGIRNAASHRQTSTIHLSLGKSINIRTTAPIEQPFSQR